MSIKTKALKLKLTELLTGLNVEKDIAEALANDFINTNFTTLHLQQRLDTYTLNNHFLSRPPFVNITEEIKISRSLFNSINKKLRDEAHTKIEPTAVFIRPEKGGGLTIHHEYLLPNENSQRTVPEVIKEEDT
jgi:hypothetical protein